MGAFSGPAAPARDIYSVLTPEASAGSRKSFGGTAPVNVKREARRWLKLLG